MRAQPLAVIMEGPLERECPARGAEIMAAGLQPVYNIMLGLELSVTIEDYWRGSLVRKIKELLRETTKSTPGRRFPGIGA